MKKFLPLLSFALLLSVIASAQSLRYGITGGMNLANYAVDMGGVSYSPNSRVGFHAGFRMEMDASTFIYDGFFFTGEVLLSAKGAKMNLSVEQENIDIISRPYYLEIPIHFGYHYKFGNGNIGLFGSFGPYFGIGLFGTDKIADGEDSYKPDTFGDDGLKRFDFGVGVRAGVSMWDNYRIYVGYDWGLINIASDSANKLNNRNFYIGAAYMF